jgi:hypothetical protein
MKKNTSLDSIIPSGESKINNMNKIEFEYEGVWITDPTLDETGRFEVNPVEYYGETYLTKLKEVKCEE